MNSKEPAALVLHFIPLTQWNHDLATLDPHIFRHTNGPGAIGATGTAVHPRHDTAQTNAYMTFKLDNTSAFFIYGLVNYNLGRLNATLTPPYLLGLYVTIFYKPNAHLDRPRSGHVLDVDVGNGPR